MYFRLFKGNNKKKWFYITLHINYKHKNKDVVCDVSQ